jgi:hypothetical protein
MILSKSVSVGVAWLISALLAAPSAQPPVVETSPWGTPPRPAQKGPRFSVWCDEAGWHVTTTAAGAVYRMNGVIRVVGGKVVTITGFENTEIGKKRLRDVGVLNAARDVMTFSFATGGGRDSFTFRVNETARQLVFDLRIDGVVAPNRIAIGSQGVSPTSVPFVLQANPAKETAPAEKPDRPRAGKKKGR